MLSATVLKGCQLIQNDNIVEGHELMARAKTHALASDQGFAVKCIDAALQEVFPDFASDVLMVKPSNLPSYYHLIVVHG